jgi:hypothetical protein
MPIKKIFYKILLVIFFIFDAFSIAHAKEQKGLVPCRGIDDCKWSDLMEMIRNIVNFSFTHLIIPVAVIMFIWGGITMAISAGDEGKFKKGKSIIEAAFIGLVISFSAWIIVQTVVRFLGIS